MPWDTLAAGGRSRFHRLCIVLENPSMVCCAGLVDGAVITASGSPIPGTVLPWTGGPDCSGLAELNIVAIGALTGICRTRAVDEAKVSEWTKHISRPLTYHS